MRRVMILTAAVLWGACAVPSESPLLPGATGDYLGESDPGETPAIFGAGVISFGTHEHHLTVAPGGDRLLYVVADRYRQHHTIIEVARSGDAWLRPEVAPFSGGYNDFAPTFNVDGTKLLFCSNRPMPGADADRSDVNIWVVERTLEGWGEPIPLPGQVNDRSSEYNPTVAADGTLYFQDHDAQGADIYQASLLGSRYGPPTKVEGVNSAGAEIGPYVTSDGNTLLFSSSRAGGQGDMDFWFSTRSPEGSWSEPKNLGDRINTPGADVILSISPDGRFVFFTTFLPVSPQRLKHQSYDDLIAILRSAENGDGTIFWVSTSVLGEVGLPIAGTTLDQP
jgi:hypothetical protein